MGLVGRRRNGMVEYGDLRPVGFGDFVSSEPRDYEPFDHLAIVQLRCFFGMVGKVDLEDAGRQIVHCCGPPGCFLKAGLVDADRGAPHAFPGAFASCLGLQRMGPADCRHLLPVAHPVPGDEGRHPGRMTLTPKPGSSLHHAV